MKMGEEKFDEEKFMKALVKLKDTQESIQGFSAWCIKNRKQSYKMARSWTKVIKKVRIDQKLVLFYLVNDVVQHSSKKGMSEVVDKFRNAIKEAIPHLKEDKIAPKVQRCLGIWDEREVFDSDFIRELNSLIDMTPTKEDSEIIENFQSNELCKQIKIMKALEDDADYKLKTLKENDLENQDLEAMKAKLKDKSSGNSHLSQFHDGTRRMEAYIKAMEKEVKKRKQVIELLCQGRKYYDSLYGEAEIVATAYMNFGNRVKKVENHLKEKIPKFLAIPRAASPLPSPPDYDAPSPQGEADLNLPGDDEPGTPDYPPPSHTPPGPPPVRSHTPPGQPPTPPGRSYTPPVSDRGGYTPPGSNRSYTPTGNRSYNSPGNRSYTPPEQSYTPPPPLEPASRFTDSLFSSAPPPRHKELDEDGAYLPHHHSQETRDLTRETRDLTRETRDLTRETRDLTREAMTIPSDRMSDFLTKIAHGEVLGSQDSLFGSGDHKRRKLSETGSFTGLGNGHSTEYSSHGGVGGMMSAYTQPPTPTETVWSSVNQRSFQADSDDEGVVENQALQRLRRAANKNQGSSNLISLTGSPAVRDPDENVDGNPMGDDMELSDEEEEGQIMDDWAPSGPVTEPVVFNHSQPPPNLANLPPPHAIIANGGVGGPPTGIPSFLRNLSHGEGQHAHPPPSHPPPNLAAPPPGVDMSGPPPVLDIPPPPFRVPPPVDKRTDEVSRSNSWSGPPPTDISPPPPQTFSSLPPSPFTAMPPSVMNLPPPPKQNDFAPPLSPTPPSPAAVVADPTTTAAETISKEPPPQFSGFNGSNKFGGGLSGGVDERENGELDDEMEHYNNMRSEVPDTMDNQADFNALMNRGGGGGFKVGAGDDGFSNENSRGGRGGGGFTPRGRGGGGQSFTPDRSSFGHDRGGPHHRGGGPPFRGRGAGGGFDSPQNWNRGGGGPRGTPRGGRGGGPPGGRGGDRGGGWRPPRRPWGGAPPHRGGRW